MKKKILFLLLILTIVGITGCEKKEDAMKFKKEYESFNGKSNEYFDYRELSIDEENPFIFSTDEEIVEKIENKESFIVYFGDPQCPWCRSVIEQAIKSAKGNGINKIYYVRFWDGFHEELIRDVYELDEDNNPVLKQKGSKAYTKLLKYLDNVLNEYTLKDKEGNKISTDEKRIFLPNFVAVVKGKAKKLIDGISEKQEEYNGKLTKEIIKDESKIFNDFFKKYK
ncbi:MAG: hypothetical protein IKE75_00015 [Bacilli bacterium]|nr:hypothetical protein [Bacilli bacterium]